MKPTAAVSVQTTGNLDVDSTSIKMGVDENNLEHLLMLLTDLYSDQPLAVVREYSTNARDSHREVGVTKPIEVTLPNVMSPFFKVRDYGVGLSADEVVNVYSKYGSSTKRDSNDYNGMLGLGCKSALTYTNQFTVVSVKDGEKITVVVQRAGNSATMEIVDKQGGVNEANGVEISVPVRGTDYNLFRQKAQYMFGFWEPGTVLVDNVTPTQVSVKNVTPNIGTTHGIGSDIVVMGGVPYPVERRLYDGQRPYGNMFDVVAFVEIGDVAFTPSREALMYTKHTEATIDRLKNEFASQIRKTIVDDIDAAPTHAEAYKRATDWAEKFRSVMPSPVTYKGEVIPESFAFKFSRWDTNSYRNTYRTGYDKIGVANVMKAVVIYDFPGLASLNKTHKDKIKMWKDTAGLGGVTYHIFTEKPEGTPWVPANRMVSWNDIKAIQLPRKDGGTPGTPKKPSIDVYDAQTGYPSSQTLDDTKVPVYLSPTARLDYRRAMEMYKVFPHIQIVSLGENRWEKFKRENPRAQHFNDFLREQAGVARDALTPRDIKILSMGSYEKDRIKSLDPTKIDDPSLRESVEIATGVQKSAAADHFLALKNICQRNYVSYGPDFPEVDHLKNYPLIPSHGRGTLNIEHTYIYVNAVFAAAV
jgi:hypothetical protein